MLPATGLRGFTAREGRSNQKKLLKKQEMLEETTNNLKKQKMPSKGSHVEAKK